MTRHQAILQSLALVFPYALAIRATFALFVRKVEVGFRLLAVCALFSIEKRVLKDALEQILVLGHLLKHFGLELLLCEGSIDPVLGLQVTAHIDLFIVADGEPCCQPGCRPHQYTLHISKYTGRSLIIIKSMEPSVTEKQQFLYREIIEGGYSPDEFQDFLDEENPKAGMNLELWAMADLEAATRKFIQLANKPSSSEEIPKEEEIVSPSPDDASSPLKITKTESANFVKHENYSQNVQCVKSKLTSFFHSNFKIHIDTFEKKEGGVFQKSFYVYKVKFTTPKGLSNPVDRRYSDFEWLRDTLSLLHPSLPIPPLAKKGKLRRTEEKHLIKRMYILQKFLNKIALIPDVRADFVFENFLTLESKAFEKDKGKFKKIKSVPFDKVETVSGEVQLMLGETTNTFISRYQKYVNLTQPQVKKIYKDFKGAATMLENCSAYLKKIGTNCHTLSVNFSQFKKECGATVHQNNLFMVLEEMTSRYSDLLNEQAKTFRKQIYSLIKYESFQMLNLIESFDKLASIQQSYIDHKIALFKKKEKLFQEGNMAKWGLLQKISNKPTKEEAFDLMLPKETKELAKARDAYAFVNGQTYIETHRLLTQNDKYLSFYLEEIIKMESDVGSRSIMIWADLLAMVSSNMKI